MRRKTFNYASWSRVTAHTQTLHRAPGFVIVDYTAHTVTRPLDVPTADAGILRRVLDSGYRWIRAHPTTGAHIHGSALTAQLNPDGRPVQFYVDIHAGEGIHPDGYPWHDDLYLDVIGTPAAHDPWQVERTDIIDADELDDAVQRGLTPLHDHDHAWSAAHLICAQLQAGQYDPLHAVKRYLTSTHQRPLP